MDHPWNPHKLLGQKRCRTKSPWMFQIFHPKFAPNFRVFLSQKLFGEQARQQSSVWNVNGIACDMSRNYHRICKQFQQTLQSKVHRLSRMDIAWIAVSPDCRIGTIRHENITYPPKNSLELFSDYRFTISISSIVARYSAILRYYSCYTPL